MAMSPGNIATKHDPVKLHVATRLRDRRQELRKGAEDLDRAIGEPPGTTERIEKGDGRIDAERLFRLGHALGVDTTFFFDGLSVRHSRRGPPPRDPETTRDLSRFLSTYNMVTDPRLRRKLFDMVKSLGGPNA